MMMQHLHPRFNVLAFSLPSQKKLHLDSGLLLISLLAETAEQICDSYLRRSWNKSAANAC